MSTLIFLTSVSIFSEGLTTDGLLDAAAR
jgi:hypothetical protein